MKVCPIAVVAGCRKCPVFSVCPLKSVIGDQAPAKPEAPTKAEAARSKKDKR
ncbi:hypothetical protein [Inhella sp.]|uniref:hypothetical protein n=1 Tax=Inhella sp. TaxID=1921806 RepID=UPI0035B1D6E2